MESHVESHVEQETFMGIILDNRLFDLSDDGSMSSSDDVLFVDYEPKPVKKEDVSCNYQR